jgi:hypothetical protein
MCRIQTNWLHSGRYEIVDNITNEGSSKIISPVCRHKKNIQRNRLVENDIFRMRINLTEKRIFLIFKIIFKVTIDI